MSGEDHYHQPRQGHLSKDQSIYYENEHDYYLSIYHKNEDGDYLEFKDTLDDLDDIYHHDDQYCRLDIEAKTITIKSVRGHPTNDMSDYRALLFVIK